MEGGYIWFSGLFFSFVGIAIASEAEACFSSPFFFFSFSTSLTAEWNGKKLLAMMHLPLYELFLFSFFPPWLRMVVVVGLPGSRGPTGAGSGMRRPLEWLGGGGGLMDGPFRGSFSFFCAVVRLEWWMNGRWAADFADAGGESRAWVLLPCLLRGYKRVGAWVGCWLGFARLLGVCCGLFLCADMGWGQGRSGRVG